MISMKGFERLKSKIESIKKDVSRAEGAFQEHMKSLEKDYGCNTLEDAESKLRVITKKTERAREKFEKELASFVDKWGEELEIDHEI